MGIYPRKIQKCKYYFLKLIISHFRVFITSVLSPTRNCARPKFIAFSTAMISPSQYIRVAIVFLKINTFEIVPYWPLIILQSFAEKVFLSNVIVPEAVIFLPFNESIFQVPLLSASRGDFLVFSQGRIQLCDTSLQIYPAEPIHPWESRSPPTTTASSQAHWVILVAWADRAIQLLENVCFTGLHGAVIHWTCTDPHTGAYSMVHTSAADDWWNWTANMIVIATKNIRTGNERKEFIRKN